MYIMDKPILGTVDPQTKKILLTVENNEKKETMTNHLLRVITRWDEIPRSAWTDGHASYPPAIKKLHGRVPHGKVNQLVDGSSKTN